MAFRAFWAVIALQLILFAASFCQRRTPRDGEEISPVSIESHAVFTTDSSKGRVDITYRIPFRFFVFVRDTSSRALGTFTGGGELALEILDKTKLSVARAIRQPSLSVSSSEQDALENRYVEGGISLFAPPGDYFLSVDLTDRNSRRHFFDDARTVHIARPERDHSALSDILFMQPAAHSNDSLLYPLNWNTAIPLGTNVEVVVTLRSAVMPDSLHPLVRIVRMRGRDTTFMPPVVDSTVRGLSATAGDLVPVFGDSAPAYRISPTPFEGLTTLRFPLRTDSLEEGEYNLEFSVRAAGQRVSTSRTCTIRWIGMPQSLRSFETIVLAMKYIMPQDEYDKFERARKSKQEVIFREFWKKRDPTPGTAYNELEAEYFKRADYAMMHLGAIGRPNGIESDRGRIYMIYGPPTQIRHDVLPSGPPREIWEYESLQKRFVFTDPTRQGNYRLEAEEGS